jgi:hypothetical protein
MPKSRVRRRDCIASCGERRINRLICAVEALHQARVQSLPFDQGMV